jgi:hypothetical protein
MIDTLSLVLPVLLSTALWLIFALQRLPEATRQLQQLLTEADSNEMRIIYGRTAGKLRFDNFTNFKMTAYFLCYVYLFKSKEYCRNLLENK